MNQHTFLNMNSGILRCFGSYGGLGEEDDDKQTRQTSRCAELMRLLGPDHVSSNLFIASCKCVYMGTTLILVYFEGSFKIIDLMISVFYRKLYIETLSL